MGLPGENFLPTAIEVRCITATRGFPVDFNHRMDVQEALLPEMRRLFHHGYVYRNGVISDHEQVRTMALPEILPGLSLVIGQFSSPSKGLSAHRLAPFGAMAMTLIDIRQDQPVAHAYLYADPQWLPDELELELSNYLNTAVIPAAQHNHEAKSPANLSSCTAPVLFWHPTLAGIEECRDENTDFQRGLWKLAVTGYNLLRELRLDFELADEDTPDSASEDVNEWGEEW